MTARRRCAIYTRKSTEEGLEQDFNSLHAQREACEAFVRSQKHEGWQLLPDSFDDGGFSGGSLKRPALTALLDQVKAGRIDVVVVYKVDRLTRSLADFAKIIELFDAHGVSFVSVTQQFNTTSSMGRLTLNVLLSFAQFEREVTGERIRDKIAASKKKGMWMGGVIPLGYDLKDRDLVINPAEAETVRTLFQLYRTLGTVQQVKEKADTFGLMTKRRGSGSKETGGGSFTRGHLYQLLANRLYVGEVTHRGKSYPGRHPAIIDRDAFDAVQEQLSANAASRVTRTNCKAPSLLTGLVRDETGDRLCPTHASKNGRRYRYYISQRLMHRASASQGGWRLPARELERAVLDALDRFLKDELRIIAALELNGVSPDRLRTVIGSARVVADQLKRAAPELQHRMLREALQGIHLDSQSLRIAIDRGGLAGLLGEDKDGAKFEEPLSLTLPIALKRRGVEAKIIIRAPQQASRLPDPKLLALLTEAHEWLQDLARGRAGSVRDLARRYQRDVSEVSRILPLAFLAPALVTAISQGRQPVGLTPHQLKRFSFPLGWDEQARQLGFTAA